MVLTFPISFPVALFLDCVIGSHGGGTYYRRTGEVFVFINIIIIVFPCSLLELQELVKLHGRLHDDNEDPLTIDEIRVIKVG